MVSSQSCTFNADQPSRSGLDKSLPLLPLALGVPPEGFGEFRVAPAPLVFRLSCDGRPARSRNSMTDNSFCDVDCFAGTSTMRPSRPESVSPRQFPRNSGR